MNGELARVVRMIVTNKSEHERPIPPHLPWLQPGQHLAVVERLAAPAEPQMPILRITVENYVVVSSAFYAPGLPDGEHDLFCAPCSPEGGWAPSMFAEQEQAAPAEPVAWRPDLRAVDPIYRSRTWNDGKPSQSDIDYWTRHGDGIEYAYAHPAPQPAQPADAQDDNWIPVKTAKPKCPRGTDALDVPVLIWPPNPNPDHQGVDGHCYYGKRATGRPAFYKHGAEIHGVTHWMPLPAPPVIAAAKEAPNG